ncbi:hypothetical protein CK203_096521 [Vitis vinifera]|uniref:Uncharacterized protein n=1 Tax=Vitis vinifera TaxID=29760 RepID=A0A438CTZ4_VITVI|nr:hypothetical protein CK203_096521 [Vitis vinifera]
MAAMGAEHSEDDKQKYRMDVLKYQLSQVMSGMLVIFVVLNDLMWTALGALHLGNPNQRWVDSYHDLLFSHGTLEDVSIQRSHSSGINPVD